MTSRSEATLDNMEEAFAGAVPFIGDQTLIFSQLLDSILYCQSLGSSAWSLTLQESGFRLNVGPVEAMTCNFVKRDAGDFDNDQDVMFVNVRLLLAGVDCLDKCNFENGDAEISETSYRSIGEKNWCYLGVFHPASSKGPDPTRLVIDGHLAQLRCNHHRFLSLACHTPTGKLRQKSNYAHHHCEALFAYAQRVVNRSGSTSPLSVQ